MLYIGFMIYILQMLYKAYIDLIFRRISITKDKPEVIKEYNDHMLGVDHLDKKGLLFIPSLICKVVAECLFIGGKVNNSYTI